MNEWVSTPDKDISFEHCGKPAYWEGEQVYCSKCQDMLGECLACNAELGEPCREWCIGTLV